MKKKEKARQQHILESIHNLAIRAQYFFEPCFMNGKKLLCGSLTSSLRELQTLTIQLFKASYYPTKRKREKKYQSIMDSIDLLSKVVQNVGNKISLDMENVEDKRLKFLKEEEQCLSKIVSESCCNIGDAISYLRTLEQTFDFQRSLFVEKYNIHQTTHRSIDQFTYGSTYFQTWLALMKSSFIQQLSMHRKESLRIIICGSSQGLLALYCYVLFPMAEITGVEILPYLHEVSSHTADRFQWNDRIHFEKGDMTTLSYGNYDIVVLTSLCWDPETRLQMARKLLLELPEGSLVIDYHEDTLDLSKLLKAVQKNKKERSLSKEDCCWSSNFQPRSAELNRSSLVSACSTEMLSQCFDEALSRFQEKEVRLEECKNRWKLLDIQEGPVSWSDNQKFYLFGMK